MKLNTSSKTTKRLFALGPVFAMTTGALLSACSSQTLPYMRNEFYVKQNLAGQKIQIRNFQYDYTKDAGGKNFSNIAPNLIEYQYSGQPKLDSTGKPVEEAKATYKIAFALAEAIYVTKNDDTVVVFDDDSTDGSEPDNLQVGVMRQTSSSPKSLNSLAFKQALKDAKKVQFTLKKDIYWTNSKGEKTEYEVKLEDFYTKYMRTVMLNAPYRRSHGGSEKADDYANNVTYQNNLHLRSNPFLTSTDYSNEYLLELFGINAEKLTKKETFLTSVKDTNQQAITFEALTSTNSSAGNGENKVPVFFDNFIEKIILAGSYFTPAPTDFIKANQSRNPQDVTDLAAEVGYYWYGANPQDMLYAGPYILDEVSETRLSYKMNPYYFDQKWVQDDNSVRSIVYEYDNSEATSFRNQNFELYKSHQIPNISFNSLSSTQQTEVLSSIKDHPELFNVSYIQVPDYNDIGAGTITWRPNLYSNYQDPSVNKLNYEFNDAFALLMYGGTIKDIEAGKISMSNQHFWTGDGYILRSILSSAFNYYVFTNEIGNQLSHWNSLARPDALLGGSDQANASIKHLADDPRQFGFFFYGGADGNQKFEKTLEQDRQHSLDHTNNQKIGYQSANYEALKTETKRLLDKFYNEQKSTEAGSNGKSKLVNPNEKIQITFNYRYVNTSANRKLATENAIQVLTNLDNRLDVRVGEWTQERFDSLLNGKSPQTIISWNYDVNSYAGFLGAFLSPSGPMLWFSSLFHFADDSTSSGKANGTEKFKAIRKLAKAFKNSDIVFSKTPNAEAKSWEEMKKGTNKDWFDPLNFMKKDQNSKYNASLALSRFALSYITTLNNQELADLNYEITSLMGFALNSSDSYQIIRNAVPRLVNPHYEIPISVNSDSLSHRYIRIIK
ncbi:hypothetical protein J2Z62_000733 [Mycoplasmoides fastidiosum]|uniref:Uncharacterized protein n=1 Tax=Mycoplasmoides fastidiosum TaxID=92758 RepID=A0ABU0M014_9BACT|nr:hypothetical protein [Mycoplasmoides fastidiosum]MDQ0514295.1 hypothetical protein [Mycoplasmoides fastidiosum]UUD38100.1 hypothetical protein NPA10_01805 [Mycoplasmoides fastidiosum]